MPGLQWGEVETAPASTTRSSYQHGGGNVGAAVGGVGDPVVSGVGIGGGVGVGVGVGGVWGLPQPGNPEPSGLLRLRHLIRLGS